MVGMPAALSAADRLLASASALFCQEGIRSVGIDRILAEAKVAKATLYQAFGSKEALVVAHLERRDTEDRQAYRAQISALDAGAPRVLASFDLAERNAAAGGFIGCIYLNALTEFPEADAPIAQAVRQHRTWLQEKWRAALGSSEHTERLINETQLAYDGALLGSKVAHGTAPIISARSLVRDRLAGAGFSA